MTALHNSLGEKNCPIFQNRTLTEIIKDNPENMDSILRVANLVTLYYQLPFLQNVPFVENR